MNRKYFRYLFLYLLFSLSLGCANHLHQKPVALEPDAVNTDSDFISATNPVVKSDEIQDDANSQSPKNDVKSSDSVFCEVKPISSKEKAAAETVQPILDQSLDFCEAAQDFWQAGELDNAIQALDQAYSLILNVTSPDISTVNQQIDDLRFLISKRILEIYASRNIVVNGNHNPIPIPLNNKHVQAEIHRFTHQERQFFIQSLKRSGRYHRYIVNEMKKAGIPEELSWLPLIESGFKVNALSSARALGLWQFIPSTGYKFGLKRTTFIDERLDPQKSTAAAIAYLKELHQIFGDWATVLAAYNCGEGRVLRVIRSQNVNYLDNFWDLYNRLPRETARYVPRFLATIHIIKNLEKYGFDSIQPYSPTPFEVVSVSKQVNLKNLADQIVVSYNTLQNLNPELRHKILPPDSYSLKIPKGKKQTLLATIDKLKISKLRQRAVVYHRVRSGESLSSIAKRYRTPVRTIARANNISKCNYIVAGKILKIPRNDSFKHAAGKQTSRKRSIVKHTVRKGDSLWIIAKRYGTTTKKIQNANRLSTTRLHIGQVLKIPDGKSGGSKVYKVKHGDTPFTIAMQHNMNLSRLLKINRLTSSSKIYPGQKLYIK